MQAGGRGSGRRRLTRLAVLAAAVCLALASAPASAAAATVIPGFNGQGDVTPYINDPENELPNLPDMEGQIQRTFISWCALNPSSGVWSPGAVNDIREQVNAAKEHGLNPLVTFYTNAPKWTRNAGTGCYSGGVQASIPQGYADEYGNAAQVLVKCLKGSLGGCPVNLSDTYGNLLTDPPGVRGVEFGNEPNLSYWWNTTPSDPEHEGIPQTDVLIYAAAARNAATAIDAIAPTIPVGTAGINFNGFGNAGCWGSCGRVSSWDYLTAMLGAGVQEVDAIGIHPYSPGQHPDVSQAGCGGRCEAYYSHAVGGTRYRMHPTYASKPIWITEVGIDADYNDDFLISAQEEAWQASHLQYLWNTIRWSCESFDVPMVLFFEAADGKRPPDGGTPAFLSGFVGRHLDGAPNWAALDPSKDAYQAFSTNQAVPVGGGVNQIARPLTITDCVG